MLQSLLTCNFTFFLIGIHTLRVLSLSDGMFLLAWRTEGIAFNVSNCACVVVPVSCCDGNDISTLSFECNGVAILATEGDGVTVYDDEYDSVVTSDFEYNGGSILSCEGDGDIVLASSCADVAVLVESNVAITIRGVLALGFAKLCFTARQAVIPSVTSCN